MCSIIGYLGSSISAQALRPGFDKTISRGPDDTRMLHIGAATLGFHRLAIMGLHPEGMQPFTRDGSALVCNGEIYGFQVYDYTNYAKYKVGDVVKITGTVEPYGGVPQMKSPTMDLRIPSAPRS